MSDVLNPIRFPLHGTRLIEASAGTGKTYTLAALYVRLVLGHGDGPAKALLPPDILVVTFTEAATRELRDRVRARLAEAARCFAGRATPAPEDVFLQQLLQDYANEEHAGCAARLEAAAQWMDEAAIYTIHGFCNRMLRQHAFDSGSLFTLELNQDEQQLREHATADYWRSHFYSLNEEDSTALHKHWSTPAQLMSAVRPLLGHQSLFTPPTDSVATMIAGYRNACDLVLNDLRGRWSNWVIELQDLFEAAWDSGRLAKSKPSRRDHVRNWLTSIVAWVNDPNQLEPTLTETFFKKIHPDTLLNDSDEIPELVCHPAVAAAAELAGIKARLPDLSSQLLPHAAHWIGDRLDQYKRRHGMIGYDDMLIRLRDALSGAQGARLAALIRQQFPVAMIDEFQDTDPVQYEVFSALYEKQPETTWLMIGDPKQAIYAFRGADIHTYLGARRATAGHHYTLATNFRSSRGLVEAINHLFAYAGNHSQGSFLYADIPFNPVQAHDRREQLLIDGTPAHPLTLWHLTSEGKDPSIAKGQYRDEMATRCASHIVQLLNLAREQRCGFDSHGELTPLRSADIAILVRDGSEAGKMRTALSQRGLRSVYLSDKDSVFDSAEASDLLTILQAAAEPESEQKIRAALACATLDLSWHTLDQLSREEQRWEEKVGQFHGYHQLWQRHGVLPMVRALLRDYSVPARLLAQGQERVLSNLLHLAELAQRAASTLDGELALVRWLQESIMSSAEGGEDNIIRLESDADLIRIVTIHKSKGLEYPLVFLPFICTFRPQDGKYLPLRYHDDHHALCMTLTPSAENIERADQERLAEDLRLLYVAVTRARHACWLGIAPMRLGQGKDRTDLARSAIGYVLGGSADIAPLELGERLQRLAQGCAHIALQPAPITSDTLACIDDAQPDNAKARHYVGPANEHWWIASYSALEPEAISGGDLPRDVRDEVLAEERSQRDAPTVPTTTLQGNVEHAGIHGFVRGPQAGTFLHGVLEWAGDQGFASCLDERRAEFQQFLQRRLRVPGWETHQQTLENWITTYLQCPLPFGNHTVSLATLPRQQCQPELEFWIQSSSVNTEALDTLVRQHVLPGMPRPALRRDSLNGMLKGFIDLVFMDQQRYFVADYKSNWLGPDDNSYSANAMRDAVLEKRYDVQLCLYLLALHRLLSARLGRHYQPAQHLGGGALLFLRGLHSEGHGLFFQAPTLALIHSLDALFRGQPVLESANAL
jgi:exodeoxyribonuclease V beta subunit